MLFRSPAGNGARLPGRAALRNSSRGGLGSGAGLLVILLPLKVAEPAAFLDRLVVLLAHGGKSEGTSAKGQGSALRKMRMRLKKGLKNAGLISIRHRTRSKHALGDFADRRSYLVPLPPALGGGSGKFRAVGRVGSLWVSLLSEALELGRAFAGPAD